MQHKKESYRDSKQYKSKPYRDSYCLSFNITKNASKSNLIHILLLSSWKLHHGAWQMGTTSSSADGYQSFCGTCCPHLQVCVFLI